MAKRALGTKLKVGSATIGGLTSIGGIEISADTIDVSTLDSIDRYREFIGGMIDGGEVTAEGQLSDDGAQEVNLVAKVGADPESCEISFPNGVKWTFSAIITSFGTNADMEDPLSFSIGLKVTGKPALAVGTGS